VGEVAVTFLDENGRRLAFVARSYRLGGRSGEASLAAKPRVRGGAMQLRLDPAAHCLLARVRIGQRRLGHGQSVVEPPGPVAVLLRR
jgi:hypothetical protein